MEKDNARAVSPFSKVGLAMATAAIINPEPKVIPLAEADLAAVEELFDRQCREWLELLRWDYSGPSQLVREVLRQRDLTGFAAISEGVVTGFAYYVIEGGRASLGDLYVAKPWRSTGAAVSLAEAILDHCDRLPRLRRVESQCVTVGNAAVIDFFRERGFEHLDRHYMMLRLSSSVKSRKSRRQAEGPAEVFIRPWQDLDFAAAAGVIHRSYRGEHDSRINSQYRSEEGCVELLTILTDHIWCGDFLPRVSRVAVDRRTGEQVGVLIASRIADRAGHIGQISLVPSHQGRGIGRRLIGEALAEFRQRGFEAVSLAVTATNRNAFHLYQSCGFEVIHTFPVFYRERR